MSTLHKILLFLCFGISAISLSVAFYLYAKQKQLDYSKIAKILNNQLKKVNSEDLIRFEIADDVFMTVYLPDGSISGAKIKDGTISNEKLKNQVVIEMPNGEEKVVSPTDKTIEPYALSDGSTSVARIGNYAVTSAMIADGSITNIKILDGTITSSKISDGTIKTQDLENGSIVEAKIADGTVTTAKIKNGSIDLDKLADNAITAAKIVNGTIKGEDISGDGSVVKSISGGRAILVTNNNDGTYTIALDTGCSNDQILKWSSSESDWNCADLDVAENAGTANVFDFGAVGDGVTDDCPEIQAAIDYVYTTLKGGKVILPPTENGYLCSGTLDLKPFVTLDGGAVTPLVGSHNPHGGFDTPSTNRGAELKITSGAGDANGTSFITLQTGSAINGVSFFYPNQSSTAASPTAYPYTIELKSEHSGGGVKNVLLVNSYQGIKVYNHEKAFLSGVYGQPLYRGVLLDEVYDVPRLENIHFWSFWKRFAVNDALEQYMLANAIAFEFKKVDEVMATNLLVYGYHTGIYLNEGSSGVTYGSLTNIDLDGVKYGVRVKSLSGAGVKFNNLQIYAIYGTQPRAILVEGGGTAGGSLRVTNADLMTTDNADNLVEIQSTAQDMKISINHSQLRNWGDQSGDAAIKVNSSSGAYFFTNNTFERTTGYQLDLSSLSAGDGNARLFSNNWLLGGRRINNPNKVITTEVGNYGSVGGYRQVYLAATDLDPVTGTPSRQVVNARYYPYVLQDAVTESVAGTFMLPPDYAGGPISVKVHYTNLSAATGDAIFELNLTSKGDGDVLDNSNGEQANDTFTAPDQYDLKRETHSLVYSPPGESGRNFLINIARIGGDAADTLSGNVGLIGLEVNY